MWAFLDSVFHDVDTGENESEGKVIRKRRNSNASSDSGNKVKSHNHITSLFPSPEKNSNESRGLERDHSIPKLSCVHDS